MVLNAAGAAHHGGQVWTQTNLLTRHAGKSYQLFGSYGDSLLLDHGSLHVRFRRTLNCLDQHRFLVLHGIHP